MKRFGQVVCIIALFASCAESDWSGAEGSAPVVQVSGGEALEGVLRIKLKPEALRTAKLTGESAGTGIAAVDKATAGIGAFKVERTFPPAGKFEKAQQEEGLHLWYDVHFKQELPVTRAAEGLQELTEIDKVEPVLKVRRLEAAPVPAALVPAIYRPTASPAAAFQFDDPYLSDQWHYYNGGASPGFTLLKEGCDINLPPAWEVTAGHPDVIVAVVDGGIDYNHEDLSRNMWKNSAEIEGGQNTDDDNNGYRDDVYGWNFVDNTSSVIPHAHGTHVGGTIAAVNNNGTGVAGIAGGSGNGDGVRLMSCQIFKHDPNNPEEDISSDRLPAAIVYGANNGAVICQNSWGFDWDGTGTPPTLPAVVKEAIDYFIKRAGRDANGNRLPNTPMEGGIVIFAAGNDEREYNAYPAAYEAVVSVAAMGPDYRRAPYSNYGTWVDLTAPGGNLNYGAQYGVLSTLPNNQYGYMHGTSMACPHVSGIAALLIAKHGVGKTGFTADALKDLLLASVQDIDGYNPAFQGKLGRGFADATLGLYTDQGIAPDPVTEVSTLWNAASVDLQWNVTPDEDNGKAFRYEVFLETSPITPDNIGTLTPRQTAAVGSVPAGQPIQRTVSGLTPETSYYLAIVGADLFGNRSEPYFFTGSTTHNSAPAVEMDPVVDPVILKAHETKRLRFSVQDPEENTWRVEIENPQAGVFVAKDRDRFFYWRIEAPQATPGPYTSHLNIVDEYGAATRISVSYEIEANHAPQAIKPLENLYFASIGTSQTVDLSDYFTDPDGEALTYTFTPSQDGQIETSVNNQTLTVKSLRAGKITVSVSATDFAEEEVTGSFVLMARDSKQEVDLYPNPVRELLYIRMGRDVTGELNVKLYNSGGALVLEQKATISPFEPAALDVSRLDGGTYTLVIDYNGREIKRNIAKL